MMWGSLAAGFVTAITLSGLLVCSVAEADVAPPPDYVEQCTRAKVEADDEYCETRSAHYGDPFGCLAGQSTQPADVEVCKNATSYDAADCCKEWIAAGWTYRCKTAGASAFEVMWCRARQQGDPPRPADTAGDGDAGGSSACAIGRDPARGTAGGLGALLLLGWVATRRRLRRKV